MDNNIEISRDLENRKIKVIRKFNASPEKVWRAWTQSNILDQWWAPKPWKAETKTMDFTEGGLWHYCMVNPEAERHWCRVDFGVINAPDSFRATSAFCDADGIINSNMPLMHWFNSFKANGESTTVEAVLSFDKEVDMQMLIQMGFEGGFTMGLNNLEELLDA